MTVCQIAKFKGCHVVGIAGSDEKNKYLHDELGLEKTINYKTTATCPTHLKERVGKKIAISGGGRCNFTNLHTSAESFLSANPHFAKSALARYTLVDFIKLVRRHGITYHEKKLGRLFVTAVRWVESIRTFLLFSQVK